MSDKMRMIMDVGLGSDPMPDLIRVEKNGIRTTFVIEGKAESQLQEKDKEIDELKSENERTTKERDNHFHDIIKLENELSELKFENDQLLGQEEITAYDIGVFKRMKDELEALQAKMAEGIPVDITYTGSTNIITNLPNALYGKFILIRLNEKGDK